MLTRHICPSCLISFSTPSWRDAAGNEVRADRLVRLAPRVARLRDQVAWRLGQQEGLTGRAAAAAAAGLLPACPRGHRLPEGYTSRRTVVIGLVGLTGSGKSTYLTTLLEALHEGALAPLDISVELAEDSAERHRQSRLRLIVDRIPLGLTPPLTGDEVQQPVVLTLTRSNGDAAPSGINLLVYDASGEQLLRRADIAQYNRYLYVADGVILIIDPSALPRLSGPDHAPAEVLGPAAATQMIGALAELMRSSRGLKSSAVVPDAAVAVALSKADRLAATLPPGALKRERLDELHAVLRRAYSTSEDLAEYIDQMGGENLTSIILRRLPQVTLHAVSATGSDVTDGHYPSVESVGVVEPLVVLLARVGFLPSYGLDPDDWSVGE